MSAARITGGRVFSRSDKSEISPQNDSFAEVYVNSVGHPGPLLASYLLLHAGEEETGQCQVILNLGHSTEKTHPEMIADSECSSIRWM